jgi:hypothetical protein
MLPNKASGGIKFYCFTYLTNRLINSIYDTRSELYIIIPPSKGNTVKGMECSVISAYMYCVICGV